jgi:glycerol-3-phosphate cytidylyltransferase
MLEALSCVDIVLPYHKLDYLSVCKQVRADIFVIGQDWGKKPHNHNDYNCLFFFNTVEIIIQRKQQGETLL